MISSPFDISSETHLSKLGRVASSNIGGFGIYNVFPVPLTTLGEVSRNELSFRWTCIKSFNVILDETCTLRTVDVHTGQSSFCSYANVWV